MIWGVFAIRTLWCSHRQCGPRGGAGLKPRNCSRTRVFSSRLAFRNRKQAMRIDIHTHFQCLDFFKHLLGRTAMPRAVLDGGAYAIHCAAGLTIPSLPKLIYMEAKLRDMDDMKIDV